MNYEDKKIEEKAYKYASKIVDEVNADIIWHSDLDDNLDVTEKHLMDAFIAGYNQREEDFSQV